MEGLFLYIVPDVNASAETPSTISVQVDLFSEDKACHGFLTSDYLLQCTNQHVEYCITNPECINVCGALDCFKGLAELPFKRMSVP
jgi:hypothetical protein